MSPIAGVLALTLTRAGLGMIFGFIVAIIVQEIRTYHVAIDRAYRPLLLICYGLPAFGLSLFAGAAGLPDHYDWLLVGLTLVIPMEMAIASAAAEADTFDRPSVGTWQRRFWHIRFRAMSPMLLLGIALAVPWALLSAMLIEVAEAGEGLGPMLGTLSQNGFSAQLPLVLLIALISGGGFFLFSRAAQLTRQRLGLGNYRTTAAVQVPQNLHLGPWAVAWSVILVITLWWVMYRCYPIMVAAPFDFRPLRLMPALGIQLQQTLLSCAVGGAGGVALGASAAIIVSARPSLRRPFDVMLLPLQIMPLQVFTPFLLIFSIATGPTVTFSAPAPLGLDWTAITIGFLATAYLALQFLGAWLDLLPGRRSSIIAVQSRSNPRLLRYVLIPWLARGIGITLPALLPRLLAAVLITEFLITQRGLGGAIGILRADRSFKESFVLLMVIVLIVILTQGLANLLARPAGLVRGKRRA